MCQHCKQARQHRRDFLKLAASGLVGISAVCFLESASGEAAEIRACLRCSGRGQIEQVCRQCQGR